MQLNIFNIKISAITYEFIVTTLTESAWFIFIEGVSNVQCTKKHLFAIWITRDEFKAVVAGRFVIIQNEKQRNLRLIPFPNSSLWTADYNCFVSCSLCCYEYLDSQLNIFLVSIKCLTLRSFLWQQQMQRKFNALYNY